MKLWVTDAQLAALRYELTDAVLAARVASEVARVAQQYQHEIERLRADRDAELARLTDPAAPFVAHLQAEVAHWRLLYQAEKQRADLSVDQRLAERGLGPITLPTRPLTAAPMPQTLDELLRDTELGAIGGEVAR